MGTIYKKNKNSFIILSNLQETPSKPSANLPLSSSSPQLSRIRISVNSWMVSTSLKREMLKLLKKNKQKFTSSLTKCFTGFILLKVSKSRSQFMISSIISKNERNSLSWIKKMLRIVRFVSLLGELRRPRIAFEIYWPLIRCSIGRKFSNGYSNRRLHVAKPDVALLRPFGDFPCWKLRYLRRVLWFCIIS